MDAEEKPAEPDNMKEQVVANPVQCSSDPLQLKLVCFLYSLLCMTVFCLFICYQPHVAKIERSVSPNPSPDAATIGHPRDAAGQSGPFGSGGDHTVIPPNVYAPQAQTFYYRG